MSRSISIPPRLEPLIEFVRPAVELLDSIDTEPVLTGSLAVYLWTQSSDLEVHDVDLAISEALFAHVSPMLMAKGFDVQVRPWHVLQARSGGHKIDFDSAEHWLKDLSFTTWPVYLDDVQFNLIDHDSLCELYRRGVSASTDRTKRAALQAKLDRLVQ